jgi:hypothetical protein
MVNFFVYNIFFGSFFDYFIKSNLKIFQSQMNNLRKKFILKKDTKNILKTKKCAICSHQLNTTVGLKIHVTKMHKNINKTKY